MKPEDSPALLDAVAARSYDPRNVANATPLLTARWRGRMGLEKEAQIKMTQGMKSMALA